MSKKPQETTRDGITLPTRCWRTYDLIKANSEKGRLTSQVEIVANYPFKLQGEIVFADGYELSTNTRAHDRCSAIWGDINKINMQDGIHKVIISPQPYQYKIADTDEEIKEYIEEVYRKPAIAKLVRLANMRKKLKRNGQMKLIFEEDSQARDYWETFIKDTVNEIVGVKEDGNETDVANNT